MANSSKCNDEQPTPGDPGEANRYDLANGLPLRQLAGSIVGTILTSGAVGLLTGWLTGLTGPGDIGTVLAAAVTPILTIAGGVATLIGM